MHNFKFLILTVSVNKLCDTQTEEGVSSDERNGVVRMKLEMFVWNALYARIYVIYFRFCFSFLRVKKGKNIVNIRVNKKIT